jgi:hypothetical protein
MYHVGADHILAENGGFEGLFVLRAHAAHGRQVARIRTGVEVFLGGFRGDRCGEFAEGLAVLDIDVQILSRVRIEWRR